MSPMGPIRLVELSQRRGGHLWTLLGGALTPFNVCMTEFNGLSNARFSKINVR